MAVDQGLSDSSGNRYSDYWIDLRNKLYQKYKGSYSKYKMVLFCSIQKKEPCKIS